MCFDSCNVKRTNMFVVSSFCSLCVFSHELLNAVMVSCSRINTLWWNRSHILHCKHGHIYVKQSHSPLLKLQQLCYYGNSRNVFFWSGLGMWSGHGSGFVADSCCCCRGTSFFSVSWPVWRTGGLWNYMIGWIEVSLISVSPESEHKVSTDVSHDPESH